MGLFFLAATPRVRLVRKLFWLGILLNNEVTYQILLDAKLKPSNSKACVRARLSYFVPNYEKFLLFLYYNVDNVEGCHCCTMNMFSKIVRAGAGFRSLMRPRGVVGEHNIVFRAATSASEGGASSSIAEANAMNVASSSSSSASANALRRKFSSSSSVGDELNGDVVLGEGVASFIDDRVDSDSVMPKGEPVVDRFNRAYGTGRRKTGIARVWIKEGSGRVLVNDKELIGTSSDHIRSVINQCLSCLVLS